MRLLLIICMIILGGCQSVLRDDDKILYFELSEFDQNQQVLFQSVKPCKINPIGRVFFKRKDKQSSIGFCTTSLVGNAYRPKNWAYLSKYEGMKLKFCKNVILDTETFDSGHFHVLKPINCHEYRNP